MPVRVTICVGSSCHIKGSREMLRKFSEIIRENGLEGEVVLVGSFCMERCGDGMNWRVGDENVTSRTVAEAIETFKQKVFAAARSAK